MLCVGALLVMGSSCDSTGGGSEGNARGERQVQADTVQDVFSSGDVKAVEALLSARPEMLRWQDPLGGGPLHVAAMEGHTDVARLVLARGADVNGTDEAGYAPLHHAALEGHTDVVGFLVRHGAEVNARNADGLTPLGVALLRAHGALAEALRRHGGVE